jgi:hypothetical protein
MDLRDMWSCRGLSINTIYGLVQSRETVPLNNLSYLRTFRIIGFGVCGPNAICDVMIGNLFICDLRTQAFLLTSPLKHNFSPYKCSV